MRRVACYAAESLVAAPDDPIQAVQRLMPSVESWLKSKGADDLKTGSSAVTLWDGRSATIAVWNYSTVAATEWDISVDEPTPAGRFFTRIVLGGSDRTLHLFVELRAGVGGYRVAPHDVDVRCPQVLRTLLSLRTWNVGKTPVSVKPISWTGESGARRFLAVMEHQERNLPIVAVSEFEGRLLTPTLAEDISKDLSGLVLVARLDDSASWEITKILGKEWSCFDGAIRVYWPMQRTHRRAFDHPLWTRARLIESTGTEGAAASGIRNELRRRLLELSTYAVDESAVLATIRDDAAKQKFEEMRRMAEVKGDQGALAEEWFNRAAELEAELAASKGRIVELQDQVSSLRTVWQYTKGAANASESDLPPEPAQVIDTVGDAVDRARDAFPQDLVFGVDVERGVAGVASDAGPPEKIFEHLKTLAEMARIRRKGPLGRNMLEWLYANGIAASNESSMVETNRAERQNRTWNDGQGARFFTSHLKPNEKTGPDRCVRIYFEYEESQGKVIVGWVGRHP
jgi:hypothetical protein